MCLKAVGADARDHGKDRVYYIQLLGGLVEESPALLLGLASNLERWL